MRLAVMEVLGARNLCSKWLGPCAGLPPGFAQRFVIPDPPFFASLKDLVRSDTHGHRFSIPQDGWRELGEASWRFDRLEISGIHCHHDFRTLARPSPYPEQSAGVPAEWVTPVVEDQERNGPSSREMLDAPVDCEGYWPKSTCISVKLGPVPGDGEAGTSRGSSGRSLLFVRHA